MKKSLNIEETFENGDRLYMAELKKRFGDDKSRIIFANSICHVVPYIDNQATRFLLSKAQFKALTGKIDFECPASNKRVAGVLTYIREKSVKTVSISDWSDFCSESDFRTNVIFFMIASEEGELLVHWRQKQLDCKRSKNIMMNSTSQKSLYEPA